MDVEQKSVWKTPELIVLVNNRPEETVLTLCKTLGAIGGNMDIDQLCANGACNYCHDSGPS
jgi:hypothetical protein